MKHDPNVIFDIVQRRERNRKIKRYVGLAIVVLILGSVIAYSQFKHTDLNATPPASPHQNQNNE